MLNGFSQATNHKFLTTYYFASILALVSYLFLAVLPCHGQQIKKSFTVADEIEFAVFIPHMGIPNVRFSPDGRFFAVYSERGRRDVNRPEDSLRFYGSQDVQNFLKHSDESQPPSPVWVVDRSTNKEGPIIEDWRWLADSSGVAFLERTASGNRRLVVAELQKKMIEPLTSTSQNVEAFDIRDRNHYVYTAAIASVPEKVHAGHQAAIVGTGHSLFQLLIPDDPIAGLIVSQPKSLWAVVGGILVQTTRCVEIANRCVRSVNNRVCRCAEIVWVDAC